MKVTIYSRVSRDDKDQDPERQLIKCRQYCELHNHEVLGEFEEYITGDSDPNTRPIFSDMLGFNPDGLIIYSIDRLTRQHPTKTMRLLSQFKDSGIKVISITEPLFNMESEFAEPLQFFITWWNNYFLKKLKQDIKSGLDRARSQGKVLGRPKVRFNEYRAYELLIKQKKSLSEVSRELTIARTTLHRFKKVAEKNPDLFINKGRVPLSDDSGTKERV